MGTTAEVRAGRSTRAAFVAAASAFVPITLVAWGFWQILKGEQDTLFRDQFLQWRLVTLGAAALTCVVTGVFWRSGRARIGVVLGVLLAALAVMAGLFVDIVTSGGLA